jgi:hypothetical protein
MCLGCALSSFLSQPEWHNGRAPFKLSLRSLLCGPHRRQEGDRLGHGKAFYDKYLARCREHAAARASVWLCVSEWVGEWVGRSVGQSPFPLEHCITLGTALAQRLADSHAPPAVVGLARACQMRPELPVDAWDVRLDHVFCCDVARPAAADGRLYHT